MNNICYCGLYCENCAVKARVHPAAKTLYSEMKTAGFEDVIHLIPGGSGFWPFLKGMAEEGVCPSNCKGGSGNPGCRIRICAREKNVEVCVQCKDYPCEHFAEFFAGYPILERDNALFAEKGADEWMKMQAERGEKGFTYQAPNNQSNMFHTEFCDVSYLPELNVAFVQWKKFCRNQNYRAPLLHAVEIMKAHSGCHYVADTRNGFENEEADTQWVFNEFIPLAASAGCKHIFFIIHPDNRLKEELEGQSAELKKHFEVHACYGLEEVKELLYP